MTLLRPSARLVLPTAVILLALADQCFAGDLLDCDILYAQADAGSQYEAYGSSCGRRIETTEDCTEALL